MKIGMRYIALSIIILYLIFIYTPILVSILGSFSSKRFSIDLSNPTLEWYMRALSNRDVISAAENSIRLALSAAVISTMTGMIVGYAYIHRRPRSFIETSIYIPIVIPEVIEAFTLALLYIRLGVEMGFITVLAGHLTFNIAYAFMVIRSRIEMIPREIIDSARILGASDRMILLKIILPLTYPALLSAMLLTFALSFDDLIKTLFTSGPGFKTLPVLIWSMVGRGGVSPEINAVNSIILSISLVISGFISYIIRRDLQKIL